MRRVLFVGLIVGTIIGFFLRELLREKPVAAKLVVIKSRNLEFQVATTAATVREVLVAEAFRPPSLGNLKVSVTSEELLVNGMTIEILKPVKVSLIDGGSEQGLVSHAATVGDLLFEQKIGLARTDQVKPSLNSFLGEGIKVVIDRIVDLELTEVNDIAYEIKLEHDPELFYGREAVLAAGKLGKKEQKFLVTYKNGVEVKRKLLQQKILKKPQTEIRKFGTKIETQETREGRTSWYAFKKCMCGAHPFYDFGRYVRVTSLASGNSIIVKINDRGPEVLKHPERIIDLDSTAFRELAPLGAGTIAVRVELLKN